AGDDNVDRRSSHSNIPSQHSFEADLDPPTQQRVRKLAERFSTIEQQPFSCMCGQKFYAKSNLTTHKKKCLASKEEVDEEEDLAWAQKKRRSGGY
ncbi:BnaCnng70350D, partial [Brassica napus]